MRADAPLNSKGTLLAHLGSHSGDLISQDVKPVINDAYLRYTPQLMTDVGVKVQVGESQATRHFVNEAFINYTPRFFEIFFDVRIGKLAGVDDTPYGIHFGVERVFKFVRLGGYYERRLNQAEGERILGFYWSFVSSSIVGRLYNVYHLVYDTNTNTLRFFLPFIALDFRF